MSETDTPEALRHVLELLPPLLVDFVSTDVRRDAERCDELLAGLERARAGEAFEAYGNIYQLSAEPERAVIRNGENPDQDEMHLSLDALANILRAWRAAVLEAADQAAAAAATETAKSCNASDQSA